jgi:hypothetical protein
MTAKEIVYRAIEDYASLGMSERNYQWIREAFHRLSATGK